MTDGRLLVMALEVGSVKRGGVGWGGGGVWRVGPILLCSPLAQLILSRTANKQCH